MTLLNVPRGEMMARISDRNVIVLDLPLPSSIDLLIPEAVVLRFAPGKTIDFGEFCYVSRSTKRRERGKGRQVEKESFCPDRAESVKEVIHKANSAFLTSGLRPAALFSRYDRWWKFMDWCYFNGYSNVLLSIETARSALCARIDVLRRLVDQHLAHNNSAYLEQYYSISVLEDLFDVENLGKGINLICSHKDLVSHTRVPGEDSQEDVLACCIALFDGLCNFVLEKDEAGNLREYPYAISVPSIFGRKDNRLWIFPQRQWFGHDGSNWNSAYDYENGRLFTFEELVNLWPASRLPDLRKRLRHAKAHLDSANSNSHHWSRMERAMLGAKAFFVMFLAATGMNESPAIAILWSEELERESSSPLTSTQGFRSIKYRASGKIVQFEIGLRYLPYFRRYLELRKFLLQGRQCETLFFDFKVVRSKGAEIVGARKMAMGFYRRLENLVPSLPHVKSRQWRAAKQDYVIRRYDPASAAAAMQHSLPTAINVYSNGTQSDHELELGNFLQKVESSVVIRAGIRANIGERSIGACIHEDHPSPISTSPLIQPDCGASEGCLFCTNYRVHADAVDARKLLSARHCVRMTARHAYGNGAAEEFLVRLLERIDSILDSMKEFAGDMIGEIEREVDIEGNLDPFWQAKIETLIELGMEVE